MTLSRGAWVRFGVPLCAAAFGLLYFIACDGGSKLHPTQVGWLLQGDWGQHYLGWLIWRNAPWSFPLGKLPDLVSPIGTTVGYTDSNPWVALLLKPFDRWLPMQFQYVGPFMALSFVLQGVFGALVVRELTGRWQDQLLGAALFVVAPILLWREGHDSLTAHWLLLGMFWLHLRPAEALSMPRLLGWMIGFNLLASGIHPYLEAAVFLLSVALLVKLWRVDRMLSFVSVVRWTLLVLLTALVVFGSFGYFTAKQRGGGGIDALGSDLLWFVSDFGKSRFLPEIRHTRPEGEGFGYLGLGVLLTVGVAIPVLIWRRVKGERLGVRRMLPLATAAALLMLFAFSATWKIAGTPVLDLNALYRPLSGLLAPFRSTGRFIWSAHYLVLLGAIAFVLRLARQRPWVGSAALAAMLAVQLVDARAGWNPGPPSATRWAFLGSPTWNLARGHYRHFVLFPPVIMNGGGSGCPGGFPSYLYLPVGLKAYELGMSSNSAYVARIDDSRALQYCHALDVAMEIGAFDSDTIYLVDRSKMAVLRRHADQLACGILDGLFTCVRRDNKDPFHDALVAPAARR